MTLHLGTGLSIRYRSRWWNCSQTRHHCTAASYWSAGNGDNSSREHGVNVNASCCRPDQSDPCTVPGPAAKLEPEPEPKPVAKTRTCPGCGEQGPTVGPATVAALTRVRVAPKQRFRLCRSLECEVVYHGDLGAVLGVGDLHLVPGFKTVSEQGLVCYCFLHSRAEIEQELRATGESTVPARIQKEIKMGHCACEVRNPAGRCCLGEVNEAVGAIRDRLAEGVT